MDLHSSDPYPSALVEILLIPGGSFERSLKE
jgi:hypothetical protein